MKKYYEEFEPGQSRSTTGRTITETDIIIHAGQTGDFFPHHMDAEWCKTQEFKQRIAHGTLIFSVAVGMTAGDINPEAFSYGYDRLRFIKHSSDGDDDHRQRTELDDEIALLLIEAEREHINKLSRAGEIKDEARRRIERELDLREAGIANRRDEG